MFISYNEDPALFYKYFTMHNGIPLSCSADFLGNITNALEQNISVEFLYEINGNYYNDTGKVQDVLISPRISNIDTFTIIISYKDIKTDELKYFISPPMYDDTMEYNTLSMDVYYFNNCFPKSQDHKNRIKIFN